LALSHNGERAESSWKRALFLRERADREAVGEG
jgi:hypothetical protein